MGLWAQQPVAISDNQSTLETSVAWEDPRAHPSFDPALGPGTPCLSPHTPALFPTDITSDLPKPALQRTGTHPPA